MVPLLPPRGAPCWHLQGSGDYAPAGYQLNTDRYNLTVSATTALLRPLRTKTPTVDVQVNKTWVRTVSGPVTVRLYKDGVASTETVTLDQSNNWAATFVVFSATIQQTVVIAYTVVESVLLDIPVQSQATRLIASDLPTPRFHKHLLPRHQIHKHPCSSSSETPRSQEEVFRFLRLATTEIALVAVATVGSVITTLGYALKDHK